MYLSRVEIDVSDRRKIRDLTHSGAFHNWVESSFPDEMAAGIRTRKLWRIDILHEKQYLLVVSQTRPDHARLEKYGVPGSARSKNYDLFLSRIHCGQSYQFKVTLNPVHSVAQEKGKRGRVYPEVTIERQRMFLEKRADRYGFSLDAEDYDITERGYKLLRKGREKPVRLCQVTYEGRLTVENADIFRKALTEGIGRKKAYGFGMMTVIPETGL